MTDPAPLSPAAQAVRAAALATYDGSIPKDDNLWALDRASVAAALRAAADQVVPSDGSRRTKEIRADILAIAAELEGAND